MRIYFDTEFMERGATETVKLLSAAFVTSEGQALYLVVTDAPRDEANEFVREHVLPYVDMPPTPDFWAHDISQHPGGYCTERIGDIVYRRCPRSEAGAFIRDWVADQTPSPEFHAGFAAYDWVVLCQLFGNMTDLPEGWPKFVRDVRQEVGGIAWPDDLPTGAPDGLPVHHALADAYELRARHQWWHAQPRTKTGRVLLPADFEALAAEAETGYDVSQFKPRSQR